MGNNDNNLLIKDPKAIKSYMETRNYKPREVTTTDLCDFGYRERTELIKLLTAWNDQGLPQDFETDGVHAMMNKDSGCVFLTNSEYQACMMNGDKLETWYNCGNCGHEGFVEDCRLSDHECNECMTYAEHEIEEVNK